MEKETESKEEQWKNSNPSSSSSRSSSITSDSSDEHFDIRHFPLPRPSLSASVAQKQRDHLVDLPGYDINRIPSSVFSTKPANSTEWSIASNESLFSIHDGNFSISTREDHGLAATSRLVEIPRFEETVHEITEINSVHLPPVTKPEESEKEIILEKKPYQVEISVSEINDEHVEEEEEDKIKDEALVEIEIENPEDSNSTTSNSHSISCRSDTSNNSIGSFAFPMLQKEDEVVKTPSLEIKEINVSLKRKPEYQLSQSQMQPSQSQPLEPSKLTHPQSQPQFESPKASRNGWLSCFHCPLKCGLFK